MKDLYFIYATVGVYFFFISLCFYQIFIIRKMLNTLNKKTAKLVE